MQVTGRMVVDGPDGTVEASGLAGRQGRVVLASLAAAERPVHRDTLAGRVWGDDTPPSWARDLSALVSRLRSALAKAGLTDVMIASDGVSYELVGDDVDLRAARRAAADVTDAPVDDPVLDVTARPFVPEEDAPWASQVRRELARLRSTLLARSAEQLARDGNHDLALARVDALRSHDALDETGYRIQMQVLLATGKRAAAVRTYEELRTRLADELGLDPSPVVQRLHLEALREATPVVEVARETPPVRYARSGGVSVAYQVVGDGPIDLVWVPGWVSNVELSWEEPRFAGFLRRLSEAVRLIMFDKRGTGLSDPTPRGEPPDMATRVADVRTVMDDAGSEEAVILGFSEGGPMAVQYAVDAADRVLGLVLYGSWALASRTDDHPWGWTREQGRRRMVLPMQREGRIDPRWIAPTLANDPTYTRWFERYARQSASPSMALALLQANAGMDVRGILDQVAVPTLVVHRTHDVLVEVGQGRFLAEHIPGASMVEIDGIDHWPWVGTDQRAIEAIEAFVGELH